MKPTSPLPQTSSLRLRDISLTYGRRVALDSVTFEAQRGTVTGLVGRNGAGKTSLLKVISGQIRPTSGQIFTGGPATALSCRVSYLPQEPRLPNHFTAIEFVSYCAWLRGLRRKNARTAAVTALELVGLTSRSGDRLGSLSGGMRRRAALAATLADGPDVLLLDEPMEGLDPNQRHDVRQAILRLRHDATILMTTHIMQDIPGLCGQMVLLEHGVVEFRGSPQKFAESKAIEPDARELEDAFRRRTIRGEK